MIEDINSFHMRHGSLICLKRLQSYECCNFLNYLCLVHHDWDQNLISGGIQLPWPLSPSRRDALAFHSPYFSVTEESSVAFLVRSLSSAQSREVTCSMQMLESGKGSCVWEGGALLQGPAKRWSLDLVNIVTALAFLFCLGFAFSIHGTWGPPFSRALLRLEKNEESAQPSILIHHH